MYFTVVLLKNIRVFHSKNIKASKKHQTFVVVFHKERSRKMTRKSKRRKFHRKKEKNLTMKKKKADLNEGQNQ